MKKYTSFIILLLSISYASSLNLLKHVTKDDEVVYNVKSYQKLVPNHLTFETEMRMSAPAVNTVLRQGTKMALHSILPTMTMPQSIMSMMQSLVMPGVFMSGVMGTMMMNLVGFSLTSLVVGMILLFLRGKSSSTHYVWPFSTMSSSQSQPWSPLSSPSSSSSSSPSSSGSPNFSPTLSGSFAPAFRPSLSLTGVFNTSSSSSSSSTTQSPSKSAQLSSYPSLPVQVLHIHVHHTMDNNGADPGGDDGPSEKVHTKTSSGWQHPPPSHPLEITIAIKSNGQYISEG